LTPWGNSIKRGRLGPKNLIWRWWGAGFGGGGNPLEAEAKGKKQKKKKKVGKLNYLFGKGGMGGKHENVQRKKTRSIQSQKKFDEKGMVESREKETAGFKG